MTDSADPRSHGGWRALLPVTLLVVVAGVQVMLATTAGLSPWKGGGFGMFSTTDDGGRRYVRVFVTAPERSEEISIAPSLEDAARRAAVLPRDAQLSSSRAGSSIASAGINDRWTRSASRTGASSTRGDPGGDSPPDSRVPLPCGRDSCARSMTRTAFPTPS